MSWTYNRGRGDAYGLGAMTRTWICNSCTPGRALKAEGLPTGRLWETLDPSHHCKGSDYCKIFYVPTKATNPGHDRCVTCLGLVKLASA